MSEMTFERALYELEKTVAKMEKEELALDEALNLYEKGVKLSAFCRTKLDEAELKIETVNAETVPLKESEDINA